MKRLIIVLFAIMFSYNVYSQTHLPGVDMKIVYESTITFAANAPFICFYGTGDSTTADSMVHAKYNASVFAEWVTGRSELDTLIVRGTSSGGDSLIYLINDNNDTMRYVNTSGTQAWINFERGPYPILTEKLMFMGEIISSTVANPKVGLMSKYWWVAPSTNASDNTAFIDMNNALSHDLSDDRAQLDTINTAPLWLYGKVYGAFMHWGSEAKTIKYKLWMARIDRRW
jgi:hypothetical protein